MLHKLRPDQFGHKRAISRHFRTELGYYNEHLEKADSEATCH